MSPEATAFLEGRPSYETKHVGALEEFCASEGIPFCWTCKDWHNPTDAHSAD